MTDPIITAIAAYRAEVARYNTLCVDDLSGEQCDALADETFAGPLRALETWDTPVLTKAGAMMALELAIEEGKQFTNSDLVPSMVAAALSFFRADMTDRVAA